MPDGGQCDGGLDLHGQSPLDGVAVDGDGHHDRHQPEPGDADPEDHLQSALSHQRIRAAFEKDYLSLLDEGLRATMLTAFPWTPEADGDGGEEGDELASETAEERAGVRDPVRVEQVPVDRQESVQLQQQQVQVVAHLHSKLHDGFSFQKCC